MPKGFNTNQMHEGTFTVPLGIAIQDGNYMGKTGADKDYKKTVLLILLATICLSMSELMRIEFFA
jgi:hypothetical protein